MIVRIFVQLHKDFKNLITNPSLWLMHTLGVLFSGLAVIYFFRLPVLTFSRPMGGRLYPYLLFGEFVIINSYLMYYGPGLNIKTEKSNKSGVLIVARVLTIIIINLILILSIIPLVIFYIGLGGIPPRAGVRLLSGVFMSGISSAIFIFYIKETTVKYSRFFLSLYLLLYFAGLFWTFIPLAAKAYLNIYYQLLFLVLAILPLLDLKVNFMDRIFKD